MDNKADILKILEDQLEYHETEVARIRNAIQAYLGNNDTLHQSDATPQKKTRWTAEIEKIFKTEDNLTADDIQNLLVKNGVEIAGEPSGRSAILTTLSRMVKNKDKKIWLHDDGYYYKGARKFEKIKKQETEKDIFEA